MEIYPNTKISDVLKNGTIPQQMVCGYFDENDDEILDKKEALKLEFSTIKIMHNSLTIKYGNGQVDTFEGVYQRESEDYYKSGYIPVAVLDDYNMGNCGALDHGYITCNILKKYNQDLSLDRLETNPSRCYNKVQKLCQKILLKYPKLDIYVGNHPKLERFLFGRDADSKSLQSALKELNQKIEQGVKYKAVNMSLAYDIDFSEINKLVQKELGFEITSDNIAEHKKEILEVLETKKNKTIAHDYYGKNQDLEISTLLNLIKSIEKTNIPFYMAASYKTTAGDERKNTFNFLSLANNAVCVEAGRVEANGNITHTQGSSHTSLSIKNGRQYIEDSSRFYCGNSIGGGTSFATPMALAKDLKNN